MHLLQARLEQCSAQAALRVSGSTTAWACCRATLYWLGSNQHELGCALRAAKSFCTCATGRHCLLQLTSQRHNCTPQLLRQQVCSTLVSQCNKSHSCAVHAPAQPTLSVMVAGFRSGHTYAHEADVVLSSWSNNHTFAQQANSALDKAVQAGRRCRPGLQVIVHNVFEHRILNSQKQTEKLPPAAVTCIELATCSAREDEVWHVCIMLLHVGCFGLAVQSGLCRLRSAMLQYLAVAGARQIYQKAKSG
jgi:hypothetical protein